MNFRLRFLTATCFVLFLALTPTLVSGQCKEFKWPENRAKADESVAIWGDAMRSGNYRSATAALQWMLTNAPQWNTKLYIDGAEIYDKLAEKETDPAKKKVLVDSLLMLYDLRIANCGDQINVLNRKVYAAYKYSKTKDKITELLGMYEKVYEMSGNNLTDGNLVAYMTTIKNYQQLNKSTPDKLLTDDQILGRYDKIMSVIDAKIQKATADGKTADVDKLKTYKDAVTSILLGIIKIDCPFVKKHLAPKLKANPADLETAKKIYNFMVADKCVEDPLFLEALESIDKYNTEKDFGIKKTLAVRYMTSGNYDKAEATLKDALPLAASADQKADLYLLMGSIEAKKGNNNGARSYYQQSGSKEGFEKIGDLYYNSFGECSKKASLAEDRLIYLAAYEMYQKAGSTSGMARAKAQFPSKEEIFLLNWQVGSTQHVGCWIGESVILKTRD